MTNYLISATLLIYLALKSAITTSCTENDRRQLLMPDYNTVSSQFSCLKAFAFVKIQASRVHIPSPRSQNIW